MVRISSILRRTSTSIVLALLFLGMTYAYATHFRYGLTTWTPVDGMTAEFTLQNAWRLNAYTTANGRCIDLTSLASVACSGANGNAGVGDIIAEFQGFTTFDPGDGSVPIASPLGPLLFLVTAVDPANNWLFGLALDPTSFPAVDPTISHAYPNTGDFLAATDSCCRISRSVAPNEHINNPDGPYRVETVVNVGSGNSSPVSVLPPIVVCPIDSVCSFLVPGADPDGDSLSFRLSAPAEASGSGTFAQPGPPFAPNPVSIDSITGLFTWDTTGAQLATNPANNTLYSTQVIVEDETSRVALDFLVQLVEEDLTPPVIEPPADQPPICETTQVLTVGVTKTFDVLASDPDPADFVTLNVVGLPVGSVMTPGLPLFDNPVQSNFSWTPAPDQVGVSVLNFTATSTGGGFALCPVTLEVLDVSPLIVDEDALGDDNDSDSDSDDDSDNDGDGNGVLPIKLGTVLTLTTGVSRASLFELTDAFPFEVAAFLSGQIDEDDLEDVRGLEGITASGTSALVGRRFCAVVQEVETDDGTVELDDDRIGLLAFVVLEANGPQISVEVEDASVSCAPLGVEL